MPPRIPIVKQSPPLCRSCFQRTKRRGFASTSASLSDATPNPDEVNSARLYCSNLLRKYDTPSHILQTFIPASARDAYRSLRALNISLANVADTVSSPTVGALRMQFWRDTISKTFAGTPPKEPIAILLHHALEDLASRSNGAAKMSASWIKRIIDTREKHLLNPPFPDLAALESYAESTYSTLLYLTLSALPLSSLHADHLASHIGKAAGIAATLRGVPLLAFPPPPAHHHHSNSTGLAGSFPGPAGCQGTVTLPLSVMREAGLREEDVFRHGAEAPGLRAAVFQVATRASDHLITARVMLESLRAGGDAGHGFEHAGEEGHDYVASGPGGEHDGIRDVERAFGVFMPAVSTRLWLEKLQKVDFDIFDRGLRVGDWRLPVKAWLAFRRRKI